MKKTSIIILNWNGLEDTQRCLRSLQNGQRRNFDIYVIDNGSKNDEYKILNKEFASFIKIFRLATNEGFTGGVNFGLRKAIKLTNPDYFLLLNNDVEVTKGFLSKLIKRAETSRKIGLVSPIIYDYDDRDKIIFAGGRFNWLLGKTIHFKNIRAEGASDFLTGCCLLIKKEVVERVGFFDDDFFAYFEDAAYCLLAKKRGYKCVCEPGSVIYHRESSSLGKKSPIYVYLFSRNRIIFIKNYTDVLYRFYFHLFNSVKLLLVALYFLKTNKIRLLRFYFKGYLDGLANKGGPPRI